MARPRACRPALTKAAIIAAEPGPARGGIIWDGETPGLGVVIQPNGNRAFIVQRGIGRKTVRRALGEFPEMTLAEARRLVEAPLATIRSGRNPNEERRANARQRSASVGRESVARICGHGTRLRSSPLGIGHQRRARSAECGTKVEPTIGKVAVRDVDAEYIRTIVHGPLRMDKDGRVSAGRARPAICIAC